MSISQFNLTLIAFTLLTLLDILRAMWQPTWSTQHPQGGLPAQQSQGVPLGQHQGFSGPSPHTIPVGSQMPNPMSHQIHPGNPTGPYGRQPGTMTSQNTGHAAPSGHFGQFGQAQGNQFGSQGQNTFRPQCSPIHGKPSQGSQGTPQGQQMIPQLHHQVPGLPSPCVCHQPGSSPGAPPQWQGQPPDHGQGSMWNTMAGISQAKPGPQPMPQPVPQQAHQPVNPQGFQQPTPVPAIPRLVNKTQLPLPTSFPHPNQLSPPPSPSPMLVNLLPCLALRALPSLCPALNLLFQVPKPIPFYSNQPTMDKAH